MDQESIGNKNQKIIALFLIILAVVIVAVGVSVFARKKDDSGPSAANTTASNASDTTNTSNTPSSESSSGSTAQYKDGTYTASGGYISPGGQETINVTITLKDDTVTASSVQQTPSNRDAAEYQEDFKANYKSQVVGKKISTISLSHVSGSSLTPRGFNEALEQIKSQAQS